MKTIALMLVAVMLPLLFPTNATADTTRAELEVTAKAERVVMADRAEFRFTVREFGSTLSEAVHEATKATDAVVQRLLALGIPKHKVTNQYFKSNENAGKKAFLSSAKDYFASIETRVVVDSVDKLALVVGLVSDANVHHLSNIDFTLENRGALMREVRKEAARIAREKAEDVMGELHGTLGRVLHVSETTGDSYSGAMSNVVMGGYRLNKEATAVASDDHAAAPLSLNVPEITLSVRLAVRYALKE